LRKQKAIVSGALSSPFGSLPLVEMAKGKKKITVISSDHTRPLPSYITMPLILEEIRRGEPFAKITILVATGMHRASTRDELIAKYGSAIVDQEKIIIHDCHDANNLRHAGFLPSGGDLILSAHALESDLLIAEGFIEPHFFAGFSGGRKSILPGIAGYECIVANHCSEFIADARATAGVLDGNPIHKDMEYAAKKAGLAFILNVSLDERHRIVDAVSGDAIQAHAEGCRRLIDRAYAVKTTAPIVITSNGGYPLDQNIYQMVKCMDTAEKCCDEGGVIIAVGECEDGHGGEKFYRDFVNCSDPGELLNTFLDRGRDETMADQWQSQILARILSKRSVIMVSPMQRDLIESMHIGWAPDIGAALRLADGKTGYADAKLVIIPDGVNLILKNDGM
jgi:nickel-dependent lactate racemase